MSGDSMTPEELSRFGELVLRLWFGGLRKGQAFFNALEEVKPEWAEEVRGMEFDPFYLDGRVDSLAMWVMQRVEGSTNER
ncbi:MAG: hypothetical protein AAFU79_02055 [Myxococcota bacterium]